MRLPAQSDRKSWQPLTPRGVAAFAGSPVARLLAVQLVFAVLAGGVVAWFLSTSWYPTIRAAIRHLPERGEIRHGRLIWGGDSPQLLAEGNYIAFVVDLAHTGRVRSPADVQVEFGRDSVRIFSLLGYVECGYPDFKGWVIMFDRPELEPWWGAWGPPLLWIAGLVTVAGLMASWAVLAAGECWVVWLVGFFANRDLRFASSWKLAGAALMPGAFVMTAAIIMYGLGVLNPATLLFIAGGHLLVGWFYSVASVFFVPRLKADGDGKGNPFAAPAQPGDPGQG